MKKIGSIVQDFFHRVKRINWVTLGKECVFFSRFFILVISYLLFYLFRSLIYFRLLSRLLKPLRPVEKMAREKVFRLFNTRGEGETSSLDLIELAVHHLKAKKNRTVITIGGMSIGFGAVIFLLSLGYGTQRLVISRVARLEEMRQINVTVGRTASLSLNDQTITDFKDLDGVTEVLPLISTVAKVNYNNSVSDVIAYGVTKEYLEESAVQPVQGKLFENGKLTSIFPQEGKIEGTGAPERFSDAKMGKQISQVRYSIHPLIWKSVRSGPSTDAPLLGYTRLETVDQMADEVWGNSYESPDQLIEGSDTFGNTFSPWVNDTFPLWEKVSCDAATNQDCVDGEYQTLKVGGLQLSQAGFITETDVSITRHRIISETNPRLTEGEIVERIQFRLPKDVYVQLYSDPSSSADLQNLFSTQHTESALHPGELVYGGSYYSEGGWGHAGENDTGTRVGYWIRARLPQWRKVDCKDCTDAFLQEVDDEEKQVEAVVFIQADKANIVDMDVPPRATQAAAGDADSGTSSTSVASASGDLSDELVSENGLELHSTVLDDGSIEWVVIASDSATVGGSATRDILSFPPTAQREAIVNRAMLKILNLTESQAVGQVFSTVFRLDEELFEQEGYHAESEATDYIIVAVIPDEKTPAFYFPFSDLKNLGVSNYSQLKVITRNQNVLPDVRQTIESLGYKTASVVDTVGRINSLFDTIRVFLSLLGFIALGVAALGMFNTLTVSLLEKTREVGLMKVIGMKSSEINRLFLAESIIMGLAGGIFGLVFSIIGGKLLSLVVSTIAVARGVGYINLVHVPFGLAVGIIILSFIIGVLTGMYPSRRAMKISALNALRYE